MYKVKINNHVYTYNEKKTLEEIANELIEYSINGYKEDMKNRIRERLVGNIMDSTPHYCGVSLQTLIDDAITRRLNGGY